MHTVSHRLTSIATHRLKPKLTESAEERCGGFEVFAERARPSPSRARKDVHCTEC